MKIKPFPLGPDSRRAILILKDEDIVRSEYESGIARKLLNEESFVLRFPIAQQGDVSPALKYIINARLANPGHILVQSPYNQDSYVDADGASQRFAIQKHMYFSLLCQCLGAKRVEVRQVDVISKSSKSSFSIEGGKPAVAGGKASVEAKDAEKLTSSLSLVDEFEGGEPDIPSAEALLNNTGLIADPNMHALLEMRRYASNRSLSRKFDVDLSSESKSNLKVAVGLNIPAYADGSAEYQHALAEQREYRLSYSVEF